LIFLLPLIVATLIILPFKATRRALGWLRIGTIDRLSWILLGVTSIVSVVALLVWAYWTDNLGLGIKNMQAFSQYPLWLMVAVVVPVFALINAALEEAVYRGILQQGLMHVLTNNALILILQASAFAAAHFAAGFPNGAMGYLMVFTWGSMLGYLRIRTNGMLIPYLAHVMADLVIGYTLYAFSLAMQ
jgi:membrane protease YdiL (CAAX protease family)